MPVKRPAIGFIFITLLLDVTGWGIIIPVMPNLVRELLGGKENGLSSVSDAATYGGWLIASYAITQFFCAPIVGGLSDRYGRRPVLLGSLLGFGIDFLFQGFAPTISWLFLGRIIAGVMGASFSTAGAYIADISTPENKAQNFGMIGAAFGLGFIVGPVIGGVAWRIWFARAFLCSCWAGFSEFFVRLFYFAGIAETGKQKSVYLGAGEPDWYIQKLVSF